jgi:hypothetical protein
MPRIPRDERVVNLTCPSIDEFFGIMDPSLGEIYLIFLHWSALLKIVP